MHSTRPFDRSSPHSVQESYKKADSKVTVSEFTEINIKTIDFKDKAPLDIDNLTQIETQRIADLLETPDSKNFLGYVLGSLEQLDPKQRERSRAAEELLHNPEIKKAWNRLQEEGSQPNRKRRHSDSDIPTIQPGSKKIHQAYVKGSNLPYKKIQPDPIAGQPEVNARTAAEHHKVLIRESIDGKLQKLKPALDVITKNLSHINLAEVGSNPDTIQLLFNELLDQARKQYAQSEASYMRMLQTQGQTSLGEDDLSTLTGGKEPLHGSFSDISTLDISIGASGNPSIKLSSGQNPPVSLLANRSSSANPPIADPGGSGYDWDKFDNCGGNLMIFMMWLMMGSGTWPGVYAINMEQLAKDTDNYDASIQELKNLQQCLDSLDTSDAEGSKNGYWYGSQMETFTIKHVDDHGSMTVYTKTETVGDYLANDLDATIHVTHLRTDGTTGRDANVQKLQGVQQELSTEENKYQTTLSQDTNTKNSNLDVAKQLLQATVDLLKTVMPKPL